MKPNYPYIFAAIIFSGLGWALDGVNFVHLLTLMWVLMPWMDYCFKFWFKEGE